MIFAPWGCSATASSQKTTPRLAWKRPPTFSALLSPIEVSVLHPLFLFGGVHPAVLRAPNRLATLASCRPPLFSQSTIPFSTSQFWANFATNLWRLQEVFAFSAITDAAHFYISNCAFKLFRWDMYKGRSLLWTSAPSSLWVRRFCLKWVRRSAWCLGRCRGGWCRWYPSTVPPSSLLQHPVLGEVERFGATPPTTTMCIHRLTGSATTTFTILCSFSSCWSTGILISEEKPDE